MKLKEEKNLLHRITEYGIEHNDFTLEEMVADLKLSKDDEGFVLTSLISDRDTLDTNHILVITKTVFQSLPIEELGKPYSNDRQIPKKDMYNSSYRLLPNAYYNYVDYLEIKEARKSSKWAFWLSIAAIILSTVVGGVQIYLQLYLL